MTSQSSLENDDRVSDQQLLCMLVKTSQLHALLYHFYGCGFLFDYRHLICKDGGITESLSDGGRIYLILQKKAKMAQYPSVIIVANLCGDPWLQTYRPSGQRTGQYAGYSANFSDRRFENLVMPWFNSFPAVCLPRRWPQLETLNFGITNIEMSDFCHFTYYCMHVAEISYLETNAEECRRVINKEMRIAAEREEEKMQRFRVQQIGGTIRTNEEEAEINTQMADVMRKMKNLQSQ